MRTLIVFVFLIIAISNVSADTSQRADDCTIAGLQYILTLCKQNDTDCQNSQKIVENCITQCNSGTDKSNSYAINCIKTTCTTTNQTVQSWLNRYLACLHLSKLSFSILLLALFALIF